MIVVEVELLTGRYVATAHHRRDQGEWPPHPARLFSALVDAWGEDEENVAEAELLRAMEKWGPPLISASAAWRRTVLTQYVPVNDASVGGLLTLQNRRYPRVNGALEALAQMSDSDGDRRTAKKHERELLKSRDVDKQVSEVGRTPVSAALEMFPEHRVKQPRQFPSVTASDPRVVYVWPDVSLEASQLATLDALLARVSRLGHSSSLVSCRVAEHAETAARFVPDDRGELMLRGVGEGQFDALVSDYRRHRASQPRSLPHRAIRYRDRESIPDDPPPVPTSVLSGGLLVFERVGGPRLPLTRGVDVARALRGALMSHAVEPIPEALSGHRVDSSGRTLPSDRPHAAFLALPFVGHEHATGHIMGVAVLLPRELGTADRQAITDAVARWREAFGDNLELRLGRAGVLRIARQHDMASAASLASVTWAARSARWLSVTPIALDRHPGDLWGRSSEKVGRAFSAAAETVADSCEHVGLPRPSTVTVRLSPFTRGSRDAREFPRLVQGKGERRVSRSLVHASIAFEVEVAGPIVLGAGRYIGLGLMRPSRVDGADHG